MTSYIQQLVDHIKKNLRKGYTSDSIKYSLIKQGYTKISIEKAIELANKQIAEEIPSMKEKPEITVKIIGEGINDFLPREKNEEPPKKGFWRSLFGK